MILFQMGFTAGAFASAICLACVRRGKYRPTERGTPMALFLVGFTAGAFASAIGLAALALLLCCLSDP